MSLLRLLQLASPALPLGAYSYSEGLETLVEWGEIANSTDLAQWLEQELSYGAIRLEVALAIRSYRCILHQDVQGISYWNAWSSAAKETEELRNQSWQMGSTLLRLLIDLQTTQSKSNSGLPEINSLALALARQCNYAIAFGIGAAYWQIEPESAVLGYLHSWAANLISVGVKLIPLGQTVGQTLLLQLDRLLLDKAKEIILLEDDELASCSWGLGLASMAHATQYSRLFRS
jgi:urease accessory protein